MKHIKAVQFQEQSKKVQKVLLDWWTPKDDDLFQTGIFGRDIVLGYDEDRIGEEILSNCGGCCYGKNEVIPLFTEGQLREFIEDKTNGHVFYHYNSDNTITIYKGYFDLENDFEDDGYNAKRMGEYSYDLLQAYWKVACDVAKEDN